MRTHRPAAVTVAGLLALGVSGCGDDGAGDQMTEEMDDGMDDGMDDDTTDADG